VLQINRIMSGTVVWGEERLREGITKAEGAPAWPSTKGRVLKKRYEEEGKTIRDGF